MVIALIISALALVICCFITSYFKFKTQELEYKKIDSQYTEKTIRERTELEIEQERTKQRLLDKEKEAEKTKQLEIRSNHQKETGKELYRY